MGVGMVCLIGAGDNVYSEYLLLLLLGLLSLRLRWSLDSPTLAEVIEVVATDREPKDVRFRNPCDMDSPLGMSGDGPRLEEQPPLSNDEVGEPPVEESKDEDGCASCSKESCRPDFDEDDEGIIIC